MYAFGELETISNPGSNREKGTPPMKKKNIPTAVASTNAYEALEDWARSRVQVWLQALLEDEVTQFLGREKSERGADRRGYRNGHGKPRRFAMMNGTMEVRRPRVRNTTDRFESQVLPYFRRKSKQLGERLPDLYLHGLATGDFEQVMCGLLDPNGPHFFQEGLNVPNGYAVPPGPAEGSALGTSELGKLSISASRTCLLSFSTCRKYASSWTCSESPKLSGRSKICLRRS